MRIKNVRGYTLEIADTGDRVEPGAEVEVDDDLGKSLLEQPDNWASAKAATSGKSKED